MIQLKLVVLLAIALAPGLAAQESTKGVIEGAVFDEHGAVVPEATVLLVDLKTLLTKSLKTDAEGMFRFQDLSENEYLIISRAACFRPAISRIRLKATGSKPLRIKLRFGGEGCSTTQ